MQPCTDARRREGTDTPRPATRRLSGREIVQLRQLGKLEPLHGRRSALPCRRRAASLPSRHEWDSRVPGPEVGGEARRGAQPLNRSPGLIE